MRTTMKAAAVRKIAADPLSLSIMYKRFETTDAGLTKYLFFTGKGGVGKTSVSCAVAVNLADNGKRVLLVSTDPASNLQDVFCAELTGHGSPIEGVPGLTVANLNPEEAAKEYRESVVGPYRGKLPESVVAQMEEQLSGSCTVEIAAFDQFAKFITDEDTAALYDHIIFDTAPTGHTLRLLQLPSAWSSFISESTHGASCLGQLAGLEDKRDMYGYAVTNLADGAKTTLILVARPEKTPLLEADRSSRELEELGIRNQKLIINGVMERATDALSRALFERGRDALENIPEHLRGLDTYTLPLRSYNILGPENVRAFFTKELTARRSGAERTRAQTLEDLTEYLYSSGKKVIFTMGKGGVGKTVIASAIAASLAGKGLKVHLTSTDPAGRLRRVIGKTDNITLSEIDEDEELKRYQKEVLDKARESMNPDAVAYIEEDLRSPCTREIAVFRAFAETVAKSEDRVVVIDTAPTGHTLLLLDAALSDHREVERTKGEIPPSVARLLPMLRDAAQTEVVIVTLPEATPIFEAARLKEDLKRAGINNTWWVVNQCLSLLGTDDPILSARADAEKHWLNRAAEISASHVAALAWREDALGA
jgi:arsenite-transporting ATPase